MGKVIKMLKELMESYKIIINMDYDKLSLLSKIYFSDHITLIMDLLNDEEKYEEYNVLLKTYEKFFKMYRHSPIYEDFFPTHCYSDQDHKISKCFMTWLTENPNKYLSKEDIQVKIFILENISMCAYDHKKLLTCVNIDIINNNLNIYKNQLGKLNFIFHTA